MWILLAAMDASPRRVLGLAVQRRERFNYDSASTLVVSVVCDPKIYLRTKFRDRREPRVLIARRDLEPAVNQRVAHEDHLAQLVRAEYLAHLVAPLVLLKCDERIVRVFDEQFKRSRAIAVAKRE